jgi:DNA-binding HxlR family transcriptional regulator
MGRTSFARWPCSIARAMDLVGDTWTPLIVREAFYGYRRFDEFQRELGIARNTLTDRLRLLVDAGVMTRETYRSDPPRQEYVLTEMGRDLFGVLAALSRWGDRWLAGDDGPPTGFRHVRCGQTTHAEVVCSECGEPLRDAETTWHMGPGYPERLAARPDVRERFRVAGEPRTG